MRQSVRFAVGAGLGGAALGAYLLLVGPGQVLDRATAVAPWAVAAVFALVVAEAVADGLGVWASVRPLGDGLSAGPSVQFALAGDFFDTVSPAGPASSEPIMAQFVAVATDTGYSDALGVRGLAKYVKSVTQLLASVTVVAVLVVGGVSPRGVGLTLGGAVAGLLVVGLLLLRGRATLSRGLAAVLGPVLGRISALYRDPPHSRATVADALDRFWRRVVRFRDTPGLLGLIAVGGLLEQLLTATALWVALAGTGTGVAFLPILAVIPLPQAASVLPIPGSLGAYDILLAGALVLMTDAALADATAATLVVRTLGLAVALGGGGVATGFLRGWRP